MSQKLSQEDLWHFGSLPVSDYRDNPVRPLKICIMASAFSGPVRNSAIGTACQTLAELLASQGHEVTLLCTRPKRCDDRTIDDWQRYYKQRNVRFVPLPKPKIDGPRGQTGKATHIAYGTYEWLKTRDFDLVHVTDAGAVGYYCLQAKYLGLHFQNTIFCVKASAPTQWIKRGGGEPIYTLPGLMVSYMERRCVELADCVISGSQHLLQWMLAQEYHLDTEKCFVQPRPAKGEMVPNDDRKPGSKVTVDEIVFFGRLLPRKGLHVFCYAITQLIRAGIEPKKVVFLGKGAKSFPGRQFIRQQAANWSCPHEIIADCDEKQAVEYLLGKNRLAVVPAALDSSMQAIYECLANSVPLLASNQGGNRELISENEREAVLFVPHPNALYKKLALALVDGAVVAGFSFDVEANRKIWCDWHANLADDPALRAKPDEKHTTKNPLVSVCLAHYERPDLIKQAISSLEQQTYDNFEVILVDDGSVKPASTRQLSLLEADFKAKGWKIVYQDNLYLGASRNTAARNAKGKYLLFMDDDNLAKPDEIATFVKIAEENDIDILTCFADVFTENSPANDSNIIYRTTPVGADVATGMFLNVFGDSNCFVRRTSWEKIGGFSEDFGVGLDDQEFFARAVLSGIKLEVIPESLYYYRKPANDGLKTMHYNQTAGRMRVLRPYLDAITPVFRDTLLYTIGLEEKFRRFDRSNRKQKLDKLARDPWRFFADSHYGWMKPLRYVYGRHMIGSFSRRTLRFLLSPFID